MFVLCFLCVSVFSVVVCLTKENTETQRKAASDQSLSRVGSKSRSGLRLPDKCAETFALLVTGACWHRACPPSGVIDFCALSALEVNNRCGRLYRKATQLAAPNLVLLFQSLEVVVEHSRVADEAHLSRGFDVARSNDSAAPRADNIKCRLEVF
jgi:hypothetical protein